MEINWTDQFDGAITICDRDGKIVYMNEKSIKQFTKYGGEKLIGSNLIDCHPEPAKSKLIEMLKKPTKNTQTIDNRGIFKVIHQTPWLQNNEFKGIVEISFEIPTEIQHTHCD